MVSLKKETMGKHIYEEFFCLFDFCKTIWKLKYKKDNLICYSVWMWNVVVYCKERTQANSEYSLLRGTRKGSEGSSTTKDPKHSKVIKFTRQKWTGHVPTLKNIRKLFNILLKKPRRKNQQVNLEAGSYRSRNREEELDLVFWG